MSYRIVWSDSALDRVTEFLTSPIQAHCGSQGQLIEKSRDWSEVLSGVHRLRRNVPPEETALRRAFATWLKKVILPRFGLSPEDAEVSLEEVETMLAESIDRWNRQIREEGRQEGEALVVLRQLRLKFGPLAPEIEERVRSAEAGLLLEWSERVLAAERLQDVFRD